MSEAYGCFSRQERQIREQDEYRRIVNSMEQTLTESQSDVLSLFIAACHPQASLWCFIHRHRPKLFGRELQTGL